MVSSAHELATRAGLAILDKGGNAFDAAIAIAATLGVVEPQNSGVGGYGTILTYAATTKDVQFLNCSAHIPRGVDSDVFREPTPGHRANRSGPKAISTPGNVPAWEAMSKRYGKLPWRDLFAPAIQAARGFELGPRAARAIARSWKRMPEHARAFYGKAGRPLRPGDTLVQTDLAATLRAIATAGAGVLRDGRIAEAIDATARKKGSFLRLEDLRTAEAEWRKAVSVRYRDCLVHTASPPATAFPSLIRLRLMEQFDVAKLGHNSVPCLHRFAEVTKHAFWCRLRFAGDPDRSPPPLEKLFSEDYARKTVAAIQLDRARDFVPPGIVTKPGKNTTHFVVADEAGNIVTATQTLGNWFGSAVMPEGTGIWLNNSLEYCTFEPKGNPMDAHAGQRKLSGDCPTIVFKNDRPWLALGTPGGHTIGQTVPQIVMNAIDFGMDIRAAIAAPRVSFMDPNRLLVERTIPERTREALKELGHDVRIVGGIGNAHGLEVVYSGAGLRYVGSADPRGTGVARGR